MEFHEWLEGELKARGMRAQDLANDGNIDPATVSSLLNDQRKLGPDVGRRVAKALQLPQWVVFMAGGLMTEAPDYVGQSMPPVMASIVREVRKAEEKDQRLLLAMIRTLTQYLHENEPTETVTKP